MKLSRSTSFKVALAILVGAAIAWIFWPGAKSTKPSEALLSLSFHRQKVLAHYKAGDIINAENEKYWKIYYDNAAMRTLDRDSLRARYLDSIQSQIRRKFTRQHVLLPDVKARHLQVAKRKCGDPKRKYAVLDANRLISMPSAK